MGMSDEKRLIDANDAEQYAREHILDANERYTILDFLRECATVDATEVFRGHWVQECKNRRKCPKCGFGRNMDTQLGWNFCPNCGADLR